MQNRGDIDINELRFLLAGSTSNEVSEPNPSPDWTTDQMWIDICNLDKLPTFAGICNDWKANVAAFKEIFDATDAHRHPMPEPWASKLTPFQRICFIRCIRPDKCIGGLQDYIAANLGQRFIEPPPFELSVCYKDSSPTTPLIFVLSSGADPMADLLKLADEMAFTRKFEKVRVGG